MADLAKGKVTDPKLLQELTTYNPDRAMSSLSEALNSQCRKPPSCPRRIPDVYANWVIRQP
jgi:hypothetical protein